MIALISSILTLIGLIIKEFFSAKAEANAKQEKFEIDQKVFEGLIIKAVIRQRKALDKINPNSPWDEADKKKH